MTSTLAAVLVETGKPLELLDLEIPALKPGQVLVDVAYSGVCQSQLNEISGKKGPDRYLPHVLGHEGAGVVAAIGEGVNKVRPGDRVVLSWLRGRGADVPGTVYQSKIGIVNSGAISTFMNRTVTCESRLTPLPANVPLREAALLGCAIPTGAGIVLN
ncbi:MAG: alcohol dehydrogenase catalytic domain-containing protein, partial [Alphaproteobacteria bacterium]